MEDLSNAGYHVVAPDLRGYGSTDAPEEVSSYALDVLMADMTGLLDAIGKRTAALVAHDWGAAIGWALAATQPERFPVVSLLSVPPSNCLGCWSEHSNIAVARYHNEDNFFYTLYHNECEPHNAYGEPWPFVPGVNCGVADREYDSDVAQCVPGRFRTKALLQLLLPSLLFAPRCTIAPLCRIAASSGATSRQVPPHDVLHHARALVQGSQAVGQAHHHRPAARGGRLAGPAAAGDRLPGVVQRG
jgi:pimeloyl-ACP methyl ester carboxylesterase